MRFLNSELSLLELHQFVLTIKVESHPKILFYLSFLNFNLKHVITITNMILALIDFIQNFGCFSGEREKIVYFYIRYRAVVML